MPSDIDGKPEGRARWRERIKRPVVEDIHFDCKEIVDHFSKAMLEFWNDDSRRTCKNCDKKVEKAQPVKAL